MWTENIYSNGDVEQLKHLAEIGVNIDDHELDRLLAEEVEERFDRVRDRIEHIETMIGRLDYEKRSLEEILRGSLYEFL